MTLVGKVNQELVRAINSHGAIAVGLNGADARIIKASQLDPALGRVGKVDQVDTRLIEDLIMADYIPVIATVGYGDAGDVTALSAGVQKAHIINGTILHSLVLEIFTDDGVGTLIVRSLDDSVDPTFVEAPVSNFAAKLESPFQNARGGAVL